VAITPGTSAQAISAGYHNGSGSVAGDANLVAANIKAGVTIFGVTGAGVAPAITTPPASQTVIEGQATTFTVTATGSATLHYLWRKDGINVGTDSPSYTEPFPRTTDTGNSYTVTVWNAVNSVTSSAATLAVNPLAITLPGGLPLAMKPIPAGTFQMGEAGIATPVHQVTLSQNFYMGTYEVTQAQWVAAMGSNPSSFTGDTTRPVEKVSYDDITPFLAWLETNKATICPNAPAGYVFRLPTEAEWEYACRAGTTTTYHWGDDASGTLIGSFAWYSNNSGSTTHPVGTKAPNAWGLCDMAGNVWEWCQDWGAGYTADAQTDPVGPGSGSTRLLRGGLWFGDDSYCRSAYRHYYVPGYRSGNLGFRVVLAPPRT